jgi:gamma-glutamyl-gamma-aminobutyrate hydrolase PuuD
MERNLPAIGISAYDVPVDFGRWTAWRCVLAPEAYVSSVVRAGGLPVVVPPFEGSARLLDVLDGLVFTGGSDLDPALYGQEPHPETAGVHAHRDRAEFDLLAAALERDMPVLGICRGMQLLNVVRGGDLDQHLPGDVHRGPPGTYTSHRIAAEPGTLLERLLGGGVSTHSCHHQAPGGIGAGLAVSARAEDGTVEAVEDAALRFALGVLWHPEEDPDGGAPLFAGLVKEARASARRAA